MELIRDSTMICEFKLNIKTCNIIACLLPWFLDSLTALRIYIYII